METIMSAFAWALIFVIFFWIMLIISIKLFAKTIKKIIDSVIRTEENRLKKLDDISNEIDEWNDGVKLKLYERHLERCRRARRAHKREKEQ